MFLSKQSWRKLTNANALKKKDINDMTFKMTIPHSPNLVLSFLEMLKRENFQANYKLTN